MVRGAQNIELYNDLRTTSANLADHLWSAEQTLGITGVRPCKTEIFIELAEQYETGRFREGSKNRFLKIRLVLVDRIYTLRPNTH